VPARLLVKRVRLKRLLLGRAEERAAAFAQRVYGERRAIQSRADSLDQGGIHLRALDRLPLADGDLEPRDRGDARVGVVDAGGVLDERVIARVEDTVSSECAREVLRLAMTTSAGSPTGSHRTTQRCGVDPVARVRMKVLPAETGTD